MKQARFWVYVTNGPVKIKLNAADIIRKHYGLKRPVTQQEVEAEIANLKRRGLGNLDYKQEMLAAKLNIFKNV
jgi:hypothetical protein